MPERKPRYCVDANSFIKWLEGVEMPGLEELMGLFDRGEADLIVPATISPEVLEHHQGVKINVFQEVLKRSSVTSANIDAHLINEAIRLRNNVLKIGSKKLPSSLKLADSLYLAASVVHEVVRFCTTDEPLLKLNRHQAVDGLEISRPEPIGWMMVHGARR